MRRIIPLILIAAIGCSSDGAPPPPIDPTGNPSMGTGEDGEAGEAGEAAGEGDGEGTTTGGEAGPGSNPTGDPTGNPTTNSGDDTTTGESADDTSSTGQEHDLPPEDSSSSTGSDCPEWGQYNCRGWAAGLYCREGICNAGFGYEFNFGASGIQEVCIEPDGEIAIPICVPFVGEIDSDFLFDECRAQCEALEWEWPATVTIGTVTWEFADQTVCVFSPKPVGVGGAEYVPEDQEPADHPNGQTIGPSTCDFLDEEPQVVYSRPCPNGDCADGGDCEEWDDDVDTAVQRQYKASTKTYSTAVDDQFAADFIGADVDLGRFAQLYACDEGRYHESINGGVSSWAVKDAVAGELLYELGFLPGDSQIKIAWSGTPGAWTYLDSYEDMAAFYDLHGDKTSFKLEWVRSLQVYKMTLTLN